MTKHTAGPWKLSYRTARQSRIRADNGTDGGGASGFVTAPDPQNKYGQTVLFFPHVRDESRDDEFEANARLVAAAPELFAALMRLVSESCPQDGVFVVSEGAIAQAQDAVGRAQGF